MVDSRHARRRRLPGAFFSPGWVARFNVLAVGASLTSATMAVMGSLIRPTLPMAVAVPTFVVGCAWAMLLRWDARTRTRGRRVGWIASVPLAAVNAGATVSVLMLNGARFDLERMVAGFFIGATIGAIAWIPALVLVLLLFGSPIAKSQRLAERGLIGAERGEMIVAATCLAIASCALLAAFPEVGTVANRARTLVVAPGALAVVAGALALATARRRRDQRLRFVAEVEAGRIPGYRVEPTDEGNALLRVDARGEGYRVADIEREIIRLDFAGDAEAEIVDEEASSSALRRRNS